MSSGKIVQIIGAVVDVEFPRDAMPKIYNALTVVEPGLTLEVQQQLGDGVVRAIAMGTSDGLKRDMEVADTGAPIQVPVGQGTLGRVMDVLGNPIDEQGDVKADKKMPIHRKPPSYDEQSSSVEILETGIKVISVDMPSGLPSNGEGPEGEAVFADITVTIGLPKISLVTYPGKRFAGQLEIVDIGFPQKLIHSEFIKTSLLNQDFFVERFQ